jgi:DNA-directed RNA polymerase specialized sigma24 family protein
MSTLSLENSDTSEDPLSPQRAAFFQQVTGMLDGHPKDAAQVEAALSGWDEVLESIGANLYHVGSMLVGEGEEAIELVERVVTTVDLSVCQTADDARRQSRLLLASYALEILRARDETQTAFSAPGEDAGPASCIQDDDLDSTGVSPAALEAMISGPENRRLRIWLESLPVQLRAIFVLRAVAGLTSAEVAELLAEHGGPGSERWTPSAVGSSFRQALCSLASQLIHATATR